jgi:hypothetical protein
MHAKIGQGLGNKTMFELNGKYANRKGTYTVLAIDGPIMSVRYTDGTHADLKINIQERIWENIQAEQEASAAKSSTRKRQRKTSVVSNVGHYIKVVSIPPGEELVFPGWEARVVMLDSTKKEGQVKKGDRLIYFAQELQIFFAVATVTGDAFKANPKKYTFVVDAKKADFCPIDIDADTGKLENGVHLDSIELESCPGFSAQPVDPESFCPISEDDFELLSEALTEVTELIEEVILDDEEFDEEEDE